ncbi:hypothetical protein QC760_009978 [Botrytis cinerea]
MDAIVVIMRCTSLLILLSTLSYLSYRKSCPDIPLRPISHRTSRIVLLFLLFLADPNNDDVRRRQPESRIPASFLPVKCRHSGPPKLRYDKPTTLRDDNRMVDNGEAAGCN